MIINNKYGLNDEIYYIDETINRIIKGKIERIHIDSLGIKYDIDRYGCIKLIEYVREELIWKSVEECRQYIINNIDNIFLIKEVLI